jgi:hypothetical protein
LYTPPIISFSPVSHLRFETIAALWGISLALVEGSSVEGLALVRVMGL